MTEPLLTRVAARVPIASKLRSSNLLHGAHASFAKGRSFDFDDLREYVPGDDITDIDWNASARAGVPVVREHVAPRRQRVCLAMPGIGSMRAVAPSGEPKWRVATVAAGVIGFLAIRAGDEVGAMIGTGPEMERVPYRTTESHLERILQTLRGKVLAHETLERAAPQRRGTPSRSEQQVPSTDGSSTALVQLGATIDGLMQQLKHRRCVAVIADSQSVDDEAVAAITRLGARHELIWLEVCDSSPFAADVRGGKDVLTGWSLDAQLFSNRRLRRAFELNEQVRHDRVRSAVERTGGVFVALESSDMAVDAIVGALSARSRNDRR